MVNGQWEPALKDFDSLLEYAVSDPYEEVANALASEGIESGADFGDVINILGPELLTRRTLCRCLPGLNDRWNDLALLVTSALGASGLSLAPDPADEAETLLRDQGALVRDDVSLESLVDIYTQEIRAWRLLTPTEEMLLGAWVRDGQYGRRWAGCCGGAGDHLAAAYRKWSQLWETVAPLQRIPSSPGGWLALFVRTGIAHACDEASAASDDETVESYSDSDELACLCRVLPDAILATAAKALCATGVLPDELPCEAPWSLSRIIERGDGAQRALVRHNLRWVMKLAEKFGQTIDRLDLLQEGNLGLLHAARKFDFRRGFRFNTYATWWIRQAMMRAISDTSLTIRLPAHAFEAARPLVRETWHWSSDARERLHLLVAGGMEYTQALAVARAMSVERIDGLNRELVEDLPDAGPEEDIDTLETRQAIDQVLAALPKREREVLRLRYGFVDGASRTLEGVAQTLGGITRERVRQIESKAIRYLRKRSLLAQLVDVRGYWPEFPDEETTRDANRVGTRKPPRALRRAAVNEAEYRPAVELQPCYGDAIRRAVSGRWKLFWLPADEAPQTASEKLVLTGLLAKKKIETKILSETRAVMFRVADADSPAAAGFA